MSSTKPTNGNSHGAPAFTSSPQPETRTEISTLGEFGLIDRIAQAVQLVRPETVKGIGDDAAVLDFSKTHPGHQVLVSTDLLAEGVHFDLRYTPLKHLGYKSVIVNLSDIAAMNGVPTHIVVGLGMSNRLSVEAVDELYAGMHIACQQYGVDLVGGDTTSSRAGLVISITVIGTAAPDKISYRSGAKPQEVICVSGDLGAAYLGLQLLEREKSAFLAGGEAQPAFTEDHTYLLERQLRPEARTDIVHELAGLGVVPTSMIDISDGLSSELLHICKQSNIGAAIYADKLPIENPTRLIASEFGISPTTCALNGGEDYELLLTLTQADFEKVRKLDMLTAIGITREAADGVLLVTGTGAVPLVAQGWVHG